MFVECFNHNGGPYLRLVKSERVKKSDGTSTSRKIPVYNIGPLSRFDDGEPDYVARLKKSFKSGAPLIPELQQFCKSDSPEILETWNFSIAEGSDDCFGHPRLFSHILIEKILEELGMIQFVRQYKNFTGYEFDLLGFFRLLLYGRILDPASKIATVRQNDRYYDPPMDDFYEFNVYDTLDFLDSYKVNMVRKLNKSMIQKFSRTTKYMYYDVTNFFFEIERPDPDVEDENGDTRKGLRKNGVSKEERKLPIVQMGLFMDDQGFPVSVEIFPGNTLDHQTLISACKSTINQLDLSRFILVGDRGMCNGPNQVHLLDNGNGFIISRSIKKCSKKDREWVLDQNGYSSGNEDFKYKSRVVIRTVADPEDPSVKRKVTEKQVVYWSRKFAEREKAENRSFLEFLRKLEEHPENFRYSKAQSQNLKKFMRKGVVVPSTGEILDSTKLIAMLDENKVSEFKELMGYYLIVTSETAMEDTVIINTYHQLSRIEDEFRVMKGSLETRPIYCRTESHIHSHLFICMLALVVIRMIQKKVLEYKITNGLTEKRPENVWEMGMTADRIQEALNKWTVDRIQGELYRFNDVDDPDLDLILKAFGINIRKKLYRRSELRAIKSDIKL